MHRKQNALHPKAYLTSKRNVKAGLVSRTKILFTIEAARKSASEIAKETSLSYECVAYHLTVMRKDHLVEKFTNKKPFKWTSTRFGQQELQTSN
jgi:predicted transcriptional regulator